MSMKKLIKIIYFFVCICAAFSISLIAKTNARFLDSFDDTPFIDEDWMTSDFLDFEGPSGFSMVRYSPSDILNTLDSIDAIPILEQNLYIRSNPLHLRDLLDLPIFEPQLSFYDDDSVAGLQTFYTKAHDCDYTKNKDCISSYINLSEPTLIQALEDSAQKIKELFGTGEFNFNIAEVFNLFKNATIEERRLGGMFHIQKRSRRFNFLCFFPFYYRERNFQLTHNEKMLIDKAFNSTDPDFINDHLVSDSLGIGDTRIEFSGTLYKSKKAEFNLGVISTLPTAWSFKKGLIGRYFPKKCSQPTFDIDELFTLFEDGITIGNQEAAFNLVTTFVLGALDRLSANLLDTSLGNNGHFGVGIFGRSHMHLSAILKRPWADKIVWNWRGSIEYLSGKELKRMFIKFPDPLEFEKRDFNTPDEILAQEYVTFLEQQLVDQFYPPFIETMVHPGLIIRSTNSFTYFPSHFGITAGSDFWYQTKESFEINNIDASSNTLNVLRINTGKNVNAYQWKLLLQGMWKIERPKRDWIISLNGDYTLINYGIGKDWSLGFNFEAHF